MDTNVQSIVNDILAKAIQTATATGDFLKEQIPDVVRQLVLWTITFDVTWVILGVLCIGACWKLSNKWRSTLGNYDDEEVVFSRVLPALVAVVPVMWTLINGFDLLKLLVAPKLWLLEYASKLIGH